MSRKVVKKEKITEILDRFLGETDPMVPIVGILGAVATYGGLTPPLTRLLSIFTTDGLGGNIAKDLTTMQGKVALMGGFGTFGLYEAGKMFSGEGTTTPEPEKWALAAAGALEAMLMWYVMHNPEVLTTIIKQPAEMVKAIGEIVPG